MGLLVVGCSILAWFPEVRPLHPEGRPRLIPGEPPGAQIWSFVLSADGKTMATRDTQGRVRLRDAGSGWTIERTVPFPAYTRALAFSGQGRLLACGAFDFGITLYDLDSDAAPRRLAVPVDRVQAIAFAPDGRTVAVAEEGNAHIAFWDLTAGRLRRTLYPPGRVQCLAFAPDGRHLASGSRDGTALIVLWDPDAGLGRVHCQKTQGPIAAMAFSPDGTLLASAGGWEHSVRIWAVGSDEPPRVLEGHGFGTNSVAFSADGLTLATAGNDGMVRLWTVATGQEQAVLDGAAPAMGTVAFSGRDCLLATARNDDDLRIWNLTELDTKPSPDHPTERTSGSTAQAIQAAAASNSKKLAGQSSRRSYSL